MGKSWTLLNVTVNQMFNHKKENSMKKKTANSTVNYDPEVISENTSVHFTRVTNAAGSTVYGKILKDDAEVGNVSYDSKGNYLIVSLKPYDALTREEAGAILSMAHGCVCEALSED